MTWDGIARPPVACYEIIRGVPPKDPPDGYKWVYVGNREWELKGKEVQTHEVRADQ